MIFVHFLILCDMLPAVQIFSWSSRTIIYSQTFPMLQQVSYEKWSLEDFSYYRIWSCPERASGVSYSVYHVFIQNILK